MAGSSIGRNFTITTWGESHGKALGVVIDGCPAGIPLSVEDIMKDLDRRKPGQSRFTTPRKEEDQVDILSGVFEGKTTGTPISMIIYNTNQRSRDYSDIKDIYRPGHADFTYDAKYGFRDYRGGGRSSGRETAARVAAGALAKKILSELGIDVMAYTLAIDEVYIDRDRFDRDEIYRNSLAMPDKEAAKRAGLLLEKRMAEKDSAGGIIETVVTGLAPGLGEPVFEKLDAALSKAIMSIGAVKGIEFGSGFKAGKMKGSDHNDSLYYDEDGQLRKETNNAGGLVGGISDGSDIVFRAAIKPTSSISKAQQSVSKDGTNKSIVVEGRHDPIIVPRAVVVFEAMTAIVLVDFLFMRILSNIDMIKKAYK